MTIEEYREEWKGEFFSLNKAWIDRYFTMEEADWEMLSHPERYLQAGAMIYFAVEEGVVLATCMATPMVGEEWEICKLATREGYHGRGAGSAVLRACMDYATKHGAKKLTIVTNHILKPALHIYEKFGFRPVPVTDCEYQRGDVQLEWLCQEKA